MRTFASQKLNGLLRRLRTTELTVLLATGTVVGGLWAFVQLAYEMVAGSTAAIDKGLLLALRNPHDLADPIGPSWMAVMARDFTALGGLGVLFLLVTAVTGYLLLTRRFGSARFLAGAVTGGLVLNVLLKAAFNRPRPDIVPHLVAVTDASFPSGHSMLSAVTYLSLGLILAHGQRRRSLKLYFVSVAILCALLVGISRVYLGVHWPSDVLAGWTAGSIWVAFCWITARHFSTDHHPP